jgi:hypothetical protein
LPIKTEPFSIEGDNCEVSISAWITETAEESTRNTIPKTIRILISPLKEFIDSKIKIV